MVYSLSAAAVAAVLCVAVGLPAVLALPPTPVISYDGGRGFITGARLRSSGQAAATPSRDYAAFWGVPFAQPPVGKLRFKPPQPVDLPDGMFAATNVNTPTCIQLERHPANVTGAEDCLTLQIFTPNYDEPVLPVVVLIHGGGFVFGRGPREGVQHIMDHDVVLVNVDYRLGLLGYMSFEDDELRGNLGMLDQVEALRWVQRNIHHFGGDNRTVTLVGNSAGSASCLMHTMSPLSKGLFHRVIGMSGSPLNPWTRQFSARETADVVTNVTGCVRPTTAEKIACLQNKTAAELVALQGTHFQYWMENPFSPVAPVVDGVFLTEEPAKLVGSRDAVADVPLLLSFVPDEGLYTGGEFIGNDTLVAELDAKWDTLAPQLLHFVDKRIPEQDKPAVARRIRDFYLGNRTLLDAKPELIKLLSDGNFLSGIEEYITKRARAQSAPVFVYEFAHRGEYSLYPGGFGVSHADDLQYAIQFTTWSGNFNRPEDRAVRRDMIEMWIAFATSSVPTVRGKEWPAVDRRRAEDGVVSYFRLDGPDANETISIKGIGNADFWRSLNVNPNHSGRASSSLALCLAAVASLMLAWTR